MHIPLEACAVQSIVRALPLGMAAGSHCDGVIRNGQAIGLDLELPHITPVNRCAMNFIYAPIIRLPECKGLRRAERIGILGFTGQDTQGIGSIGLMNRVHVLGQIHIMLNRIRGRCPAQAHVRGHIRCPRSGAGRRGPLRIQYKAGGDKGNVIHMDILIQLEIH